MKTIVFRDNVIATNRAGQVDIQLSEKQQQELLDQLIPHAHWIIGGTHEFDEKIQNIMHCSNCKAYFRYHGRRDNVNYCYKCGAKMDEEVE